MAEKRPPKDVYLPEVLFELQRVGKSIRVTAIDPITRTEVIMIAPVKATREEIKRKAANKLAYVLGKKQSDEEDRDDGGNGGEF